MDKSLNEHGVDDSTKVKEGSQEPVESKEIQELPPKDAPKNMDLDNENPYAYLERGDFSSEKFKLELSNLPPRFGLAQLKKKLIHLGLKPCKIKCVTFGHYAFVTFRTEEDKNKAISTLQGHEWKSKHIKVKMASAIPDPLVLKRQSNRDKKREIKKSENLNQDDDSRLKSTVSPLWDMTYEQQLELKTKLAKECLHKLGREICKNNDLYKASMQKLSSQNNGLCCQLNPILPSPVTQAYRNKCEFTIGRNAERENCIGFRVGSYKEGDLTVLPVDQCTILPAIMKDAIKELEVFLQGMIQYKSFDASTRQGYWKQVIVRTANTDHKEDIIAKVEVDMEEIEGRGGCVVEDICDEKNCEKQQLMMILVCHPQNLNQEEKKGIIESFKRFYLTNPSHIVTSLYFLFQSDRPNEHSEQPHHVLGETHIIEKLHSLQFKISPLAFFQVNTKAAEVLYREVGDFCAVDKQCVLLDVCCGTGTIGLTLANKVSKVIGIELNKGAVQDATMNARINGVKNAEFICGKVEDVLESILKNLSATESNIVVVVDPPRAGLHNSVVKAIRRLETVKRLVYVACKLSAASNNIVDFTRQTSKRTLGSPFKLTQTSLIDLFPMTEMYETVMLLQR